MLIVPSRFMLTLIYVEPLPDRSQVYYLDAAPTSLSEPRPKPRNCEAMKAAIITHYLRRKN